MSLAPQVEIGAVDALIAAVFGSLGWLIARAARRGDQRLRQDVSQDTRLALLEQRLITLEREQQSGARHRSAMSEELSTVAAILDRHERWHDRHDPDSAG